MISRLWVDHVIEAPGGGGVTTVYPDYRFDLPRLVEYRDNAKKEASLEMLIVEDPA
ncbi:MAG: hypothetical protein M5U09_20370 [Gammaproteobacteria bacterium]|nr:hypothetical protein [Gammaproteobacteria bacterium]